MDSRYPTSTGPLLWPSHSLPMQIDSGEVHVWSWSFAEKTALDSWDMEMLDPQEQQRTTRFHFLRDQIRYSVCHANLRRILGGYLQKSPASLVFREAEGGKPELVLAPSEISLNFNLSHSKSIGLLTVCRDIRVGVDVEDIRPIEREVATRFFSAAEIASMTRLEGSEWLDAFYRCWTRKEAILKAEGLGLRIPLDAFDVSVLASEPVALLAARPEAKLTAQWHLCHLTPATGAMAALATSDEPAKVVCASL